MDIPVGLHLDVLPEHVEAHLLADFDVVLQSCIRRRCVNTIRPETLNVI